MGSRNTGPLGVFDFESHVSAADQEYRPGSGQAAKESHDLSGHHDKSLTDRYYTGVTPQASEFLIPRKPLTNEPAQRYLSQQKGSPRIKILKHWWMEIGACVLVIAALLAITATLYPHQNKPLPQWPYSISVNTLLSVYVVVLKTSVALVAAEGLGQLKWTWFRSERPLDDLVKYDEASRGPLGALRLLWRLRARQPLSSCGALITVVLLAIHPFAQQLLRYRDCSTTMANFQASVPRTNYYLGNGVHDGAGSETIAPSLQAAINAGIFSPGAPVASSCLTGNCTFPQEYSTLGYCSSCEEFTHNLRFKQGYLTLDGSKIPSVTTSLPSGLSIFASWNSGGENFATMSCSTNWDAGNPTTTPVEIIVGKRQANLDPTTGATPEGCKNPATNNTWHCNGYGASSCVLYPCVRSYSATIDVGILKETWHSDSPSSDSWGVSTASSRLLATVDTKCLSNQERNSLSDADYVIDPGSRWLAYNMTFDPSLEHPSNTSVTSSMLNHGCLYIIDLLFISSLWEDYLWWFLNGTLYGQIGEAQTVTNFEGPQVLETIYNYGAIDFARINRTFQNISDSMTVFIRENGQSNYSAPASGLVLRDQTCLDVRWGWIAFPAALALLTILFFTFMLVDARPTGTPGTYIWKSSPLAVIFHGLENPNKIKDKSSHDNTNEIHGMQALATGVSVRLGVSEKGVNLVEADSERELERITSNRHSEADP